MNTLLVVEPKKAKERSPSFPFISLQYAIERARQFFAQERRGSTVLPIAAKHWNYSPSSSGALQTVAALKSYGLLQDEGSGDQRKIRLTDMALRIILDDRPDSQERQRFIRQAALTPIVTAEVYNKWPDGLPSDATLNHWLVLEKAFSQETALKVTKIINENQAFAKIEGFNNEPSDGKIEADNDFEVECEVQANTESLSGNGSRNRGLAVPSQMAGGGAWITAPSANVPSGKQIGAAIPVTKNCSISIVADGEVTQEGLDRLVQYIQLIKGSFPEKEEQN